MRRRTLVIFVAFLLIAGGVVASQYIFQWSRGSFVNPKPPLNISVPYSAELRSWLQPAADAFNAQNKKVGDQAVHVSIETLADGTALREIISGRRTSTAWIPASTIWVNLLNQQWRANHPSDLLLRSGEYSTTPMALTLRVFVMFADKATAFSNGRAVDWNEVQQAVTNPQGWLALGGEEEWGRVKYSQTDPANSNAGLLAVTLATYSYFNKTGGPTNPDVPLITNDANNPFYAYQNAGLEVRIPRTTIADTPSGSVLNRLMTEFGR